MTAMTNEEITARLSAIELPNTLGEMLEVAIVDATEVLADPRYQLYMGTWHTAPPVYIDGPCRVCLAGAVLRNAIPPTADVSDVVLYTLPTDLRVNINVLNLLRRGQVTGAYYLLHGLPHHDDTTPAPTLNALARMDVYYLCLAELSYSTVDGGEPTDLWWVKVRALRDELIAAGL